MADSSQKHADSPLIDKFRVFNLMDPRSPTNAFPRTPIQVVTRKSKIIEEDKEISTVDCNTDVINTTQHVYEPESFSPPESPVAKNVRPSADSSNASNYISADDMDLDDENFTSNDPSPVVSDFIASDETKEDISLNTLDELCSKIENIESELSTSFDYVNYSKTSNDTSSEVEKRTVTKPPKKLFYTPNKKRNPLGPVDNICPVTPPSHFSAGSPQNVLRQKQWKRIQEERKKLGLESDENVPLPLYDVTASAPSKLTLRKARLQSRMNI